MTTDNTERLIAANRAQKNLAADCVRIDAATAFDERSAAEALKWFGRIHRELSAEPWLSLSEDGHFLIARWGTSEAVIPASEVQLAHMGCKLIGTIRKELSAEAVSTLDAMHGKAWRKTDGAKQKLASLLTGAAESAGLNGLSLFDTMRRGSDYWRPGALLTDAANLTPESLQENTQYIRLDSLCPNADLLRAFQSDSEMRFSEYAKRYTAELEAHQTLTLAAVKTVFEISAGRLPVLYCVDPYVGSFGTLSQKHPADFREVGCHRIPLVNAIARRFLAAGVSSVRILELDQLSQTVHHRAIKS